LKNVGICDTEMPGVSVHVMHRPTHVELWRFDLFVTSTCAFFCKCMLFVAIRLHRLFVHNLVLLFAECTPS
jgi:hypothetical protein